MSRIADLAMPYLERVKPTGADGLRATCPLCDSKRAFMMNTSYGGWICFSCDESGSFVGFLYHVCGMTRKQVDRTMANMPVRVEMSRVAKARRAAKASWHTLPEYILGAYDGVPESLVAKGFDGDLLAAHDVGTDIPNQRITFAIRDMFGRLAGVSGRAATEWQIPRYKVYDARKPTRNQRAGEFYGVVDNYVPDNRKHLYGFDSIYARRFYSPSLEESPLIITEGYKSTLWLRQLGFTDAVGLQGSTLSDMQVRQLGRLRGPYYIMLDNEPGKAYPDSRGSCAALNVAEKLRRSGRVYLCLYEERPAGTAPDDIEEAHEVHSMITEAKSPGNLRAMK